MTSLAGGTKTKKADEPSKKVVLKKEDVAVIVIPGQFAFCIDDSDDGIRNVQDSGREGFAAESWRTHCDNKKTHPCIDCHRSNKFELNPLYAMQTGYRKYRI